MIGKVIAQLLTRDKWSSHEIGNKNLLKSIFAHIQLKYYMGKLTFYCLCCCISVSLSVLFSLFCSPSDPCFICQFPCFLRQIILLLPPLCSYVCAVRKWGEGGSHGWCGVVLGFVFKVKHDYNLMWQPDSQFWMPVRIPVLQGTGVLSSADHTWVRSSNHNCNSTVYPSPYVWNGFVHFCCNSLTQLRK